MGESRIKKMEVNAGKIPGKGLMKTEGGKIDYGIKKKEFRERL